MTVGHTETRVLELSKSLEAIEISKSMSLKEVRGRLQWFETFASGRVAQQALRNLSKLTSTGRKSESLTPAELENISFAAHAAYSHRCKHIIRWIERRGVIANRWWISCVSGSRSTPRALEYCPRMTMIGKELLSGFWECPESLRCWTSLLTLGPFHLWFHTCLTTLVVTRHCRCWQLKCYLVSGQDRTACSMWSCGSWLGGALVSA